MKPIAWTIVLGVALPAIAWASPQQADDGIVTIRKKASTWSFKVFPETRRKLVIEEKEVETDVPKQLHAVWAIDEAYAPLRNESSVFALFGGADSRSVTVRFFQEGKQYAGVEPSEQAEQTREELSMLQKSMVEEFYQFDLDFPGGTWEELARLLRDRLAAAYEQQFPEVLKPYLPAKAEFEVSSKTANPARYPAIQAKGVTLALLRSFGPGPVVEGKVESITRVAERPDKGIELVLDVHKSVGRLVLTDANALKSLESLEAAFFHLGSKPSLPGADHVVALFEMAWKARGGPLFAKVKYHPETKTLMVQGTSEEIEAADKVFSTLTGRPVRAEVSANPFDSITQTLEKIAELIEKQTAEKDK